MSVTLTELPSPDTRQRLVQHGLVHHGQPLPLRLPDESVTQYAAAARSGVEISPYDLRLRGTCADGRN